MWHHCVAFCFGRKKKQGPHCQKRKRLGVSVFNHFKLLCYKKKFTGNSGEKLEENLLLVCLSHSHRDSNSETHITNAGHSIQDLEEHFCVKTPKPEIVCTDFSTALHIVSGEKVVGLEE